MNDDPVDDREERSQDAIAPDGPSARIITIPNLLCFVRLIGSFALVGLAVLERPNLFIGLFVFLAMTDWVDGKLAILLNQRSIYGARLDSAADAALYAALLIGGLWLRWDVLRQEFVWMGAAVASYAISTGVGLWKFRRVPSYHTRAAKTCWLLILLGAVAVLGGWAVWPFRVAMAAVTITNVETTLMSLYLDEWKADVTSLLHVLRPQGRREKPRKKGEDSQPETAVDRGA